MQTRSFPPAPDGRSPAGGEIRILIEGETGGMIHSAVPPRSGESGNRPRHRERDLARSRGADMATRRHW
jgi:hypothetical protein